MYTHHHVMQTVDGEEDGALYSISLATIFMANVSYQGLSIYWMVDYRNCWDRRMWKGRTFKTAEKLGLVAQFPDSRSHSCSTITQVASIKACLSLVWVAPQFKRTSPILWRDLVYRGTQGVKQDRPLVVWLGTSWPELYLQGRGVYIHVPWFLPLCLLSESTFSWEPEAWSVKLSLAPCWSVTMEITLVT